MTRVAVAVEGRTEEKFMKEVVAPYFYDISVYITPIDLQGNITIDRIAYEMKRLYHSYDHVSSFVYLYGFGRKKDRDKIQLEQDILQHILNHIGKDFDTSRVTVYVQQYEFEGLLFSAPEQFTTLPGATPDIRNQIQAIRNSVGTPEDINDTRDSSPSHRLEQLVPGYDKVLYGSLIAIDIGLDRIRQHCPGFDGWMSKLEALRSRG